MNSFQNFFKDKKVTVMGLGLLGRGIGDAAFIAEAGAADVIVTDKKSAAELADSVAKLAHFSNMKFYHIFYKFTIKWQFIFNFF